MNIEHSQNQQHQKAIRNCPKTNIPITVHNEISRVIRRILLLEQKYLDELEEVMTLTNEVRSDRLKLLSLERQGKID